MIIINGTEHDSISAADRGLQYGDGLFETIAVMNNRLLCWEKHINRLVSGCIRLQISPPDTEVLRQESNDIIRDMDVGVLKIIITRGQGGRGYTPPVKQQHTRILSSHKWPDYPLEAQTKGIKARLCDSRLSRNHLLAGIKHLNRLEQVLARTEWNDLSIAEGIMMDTEGQVIEGTMSNLFIVRGDHVYTPVINESGVDGIMRNLVIDTCSKLGISCQITPLVLDDLESADEVFLTNSLIAIWPVYQLENWKYSTTGISRILLKNIQQQNYIVH